MRSSTLTGRPTVLGADGERFAEILTPAALEFIARLDAAFAGRRAELLAERRHRAELLASGGALDFVPATAAIRADPAWRVAPAAPDLLDRRVEITAPPVRHAAAAALTSGAQVWVADFADATAPSWHNIISGQLTLLDAVHRPWSLPGAGGQPHRPAGPAAPAAPAIVVRPRGWHLTEKHILVDGRPIAAPLVDFGLYFFHCARRQSQRGSGAYFSLPLVENHLEARLWNEIFVLATRLLGLPAGTVRATVPVETVTAALEMEEILYELRDHAAGLQARRWPYLTSVIRNFAHRPDRVLPDRSQVTMTVPPLRACTELLVRTCHRRGAHALGDLATRLPTGDGHADEATRAAVRYAKEREAEDGFDGSAVAHPALVPVTRAAFDGVLGGRPHQRDRTRDDVAVGAAELLAAHRVSGPPSATGVRENTAVALRYFDAWLRGRGTITLLGAATDAAAAELARCQLWQWVRHGLVDRGELITVVDDEAAALARADAGARSAEARDVLLRTALTGKFPGFFSTDAYPRYLVRRAGADR